MAGVPISAFFANLYLTDLDKQFCENEVIYARYSDDIIIFAKSEWELKFYREEVKRKLKEAELSLNPAKQYMTKPGETWEYLGFSYQNRVTDISDIVLQKIKGKLKRKARAIYRWKIKNNKPVEYAIKAYIKYFDRKNLVTGHYTKSNYDLRYATMKELGYKSLVNEYYRMKQEG